jgi:diguanylate cyclase (GGDEF)-like protein
MLLRQKLNSFIALTGLLAALLSYAVSVWILDNFLASQDFAQKQALTSSIKQDIQVFDRLLLLTEEKWETELRESMPELASEISELLENGSDLTLSELTTLRDKYRLSDLHLINEDLVVFSSTFESEIGLDINMYGEDYSRNVRRTLNQNQFFTHRVSLSTVTGNLKKYAYYSASDSNIIVNGDIDLQERLEKENNNQMGDYLFGEYVDKLVAKYQSISSIDLFIISEVDQWSLFNPGTRIDEDTARQLFNGSYRQSDNNDFILEHVNMQSYRQVGFKAFLRIDFDNQLVENTKSYLLIFLTLSAILIVLISFVLIRFITKKLLLDRFSNLLIQIKEKNTHSDEIISLPGNDELSTLSHEINLMMQRIKVEEDTNKWLTGISQQDSLTGLANRRRFDETFLFEWSKTKRAKTDLSIVMIDVDYFKAYNDSYGHVQGDKCLQKVAQALSVELGRGSDFLARFGGEEFVCILPNTDEEQAKAICEKMRASVADLNILHEHSQVRDFVTISLGVLTVNGAFDIEAEQILNKVDQLLYESKEAGRNRTTHESFR